MSSRPLIAVTSIAPGRDAALHRATINSWKAVGCDVISVNGTAEAAGVRAAYPDIEVITVAKTAERFAKKPVPYIHDLLKALLSACTARGMALAQCTVGIINADIYFRPVSGLNEILCREAQGSLILGPRVDVDASGSFTSFRPTGAEAFSIGYDYFFMSADVLADFPESPFCLGMPFWDYWMPLSALLQGRPLKVLQSPVALHVTHDTRWDNSVYFFFHALVTYVMELCRKTAHSGSSPQARQFDLLFDVLSHFYDGAFARGTNPMPTTQEPDPAGIAALADFYDRFQQVVVHHIKASAVPIAIPESAARHP